jgi:hypothetical protein
VITLEQKDRPVDLPWKDLLESAGWEMCLRPYLAGYEESLIQDICLEKDTERMLSLQGELRAVRSLRNAPEKFVRLASVAEADDARKREIVDERLKRAAEPDINERRLYAHRRR